MMKNFSTLESKNHNKLNDLAIEAKPSPRTPITELYYNDIKKIKRINSQKEIELAKRIKNGDSTALNELILANLRFGISVTKQNQHKFL